MGDPLADCEQVLFARDPRSGARAIVAVHDTALGPAFGGIRRRRYPSLDAALQDALALARAMTWKCAMAGLPAGGGKIVLLDGDGVDRRAAYELVGEQVEMLQGRMYTGPDVGTTVADLQVVGTRTRHCAQQGHGDLGGSTARGVFAALRATADHAGVALDGARVLVQGVGAVGRRLCALLHAAGARLLVSDPDAAAVAAVVDEFGAEAIDPAAATATPCDLFAPCALGAVLDLAAAERLPARAVCGGANNVLADAAAGRALHRRGVPVAPDFVANAGGLIHGVLHELRGESITDAHLDAIGATTASLLQQSRRDDVPPGELALRAAQERVAAARAR
ncbi:MAG: Glu/Leu/Phe/Val dehydrogenase dimerization domain-containing protein [Planctomycetota bacterium]